MLQRPDLQALVEAGLDRRAAPLLDGLEDGDPVVRAQAAYVLASVQDPASARPLVVRLQDPEAAVRLEAAFALGQVGGDGVADALLAAQAVEEDPGVRPWMLEALGKVGDGRALQGLLDTLAEDAEGFPRALFHFGRRGVALPAAGPLLLASLTHPDGEVAELAAQALATGQGIERWGVTPSDVRAMVQEDDLAGSAVGPLLGILARSGAGEDVPTFVRYLNEGSTWRVRRAAALALAGHPGAGADADAPGALLAALDDPSPHVATTAASALAAMARRPPPSPIQPERLAGWIRGHPERPAVGATLLPGLVGSEEDDLVVAFARGEVAAGAGWMAYPALGVLGSPDGDRVLLDGLRGDRRSAYAAAGALVDRVMHLDPGTPLLDSVATHLESGLARWGPLAPASDARGAGRLVQALLEARPGAWPALERAAAAHAHAMIRTAAWGRPVEGLPEPVPPRAAVDWERLRSAGPSPRLEFITEHGSFVVELDPVRAPLSVSSILGWVESGAWDRLPFHRVEADFILQSGDMPHAEGHGGPAAGLRSEFTRLHFAPGVLGVASAGKDTEGSQYFITHGHAASLDGRYSAVGRVVSGGEVADRVALGDSLVQVRRAAP